MREPQNLRTAGDRIEQALDELAATADPRTINLAEEILRLVTELYGAGFGRAMELAREHAPELIAAFVEDELVASLLLVHGLHPTPLAERVEAALVSVRPLLAQHGGDVELLGIDDEVGAVVLRLLGSCDGCPSSASTLQGAVEVLSDTSGVDPDELQRRLGEFAEQMQGAQRLAWADNAIKLAVDLTVAAINRANIQGTTDQQADQLRQVMATVFPEAVTLVREAREGLQ